MEIQEILSHCDHTQLSPTATWKDIRALIDDGVKYKTASVCIPPCFVSQAKAYAKGGVKICTVIGFPNGYSSTAVKVFETAGAVMDGADEIDMVINLCDLKAKNFRKILEEIMAVRAACAEKILKVIVETCLLTDEEKVKMCEIVAAAKADYIKTSTGFSKAGATFDDVTLFKQTIDQSALPIKIKAAGGISSLEDAERFLSLGADRLGTSRIVKIVKEENLL